MSRMKAVVFTDLDGTLLDHDTYSFEPALSTLEDLAKLDVPVIPVTSKTRPEVEGLRKALGLSTPFIVENGAAIYIPEEAKMKANELSQAGESMLCKAFSPERAFWSEMIAGLHERFPGCFKSFTDLGDEGIAEATGLSIQQASLANTREYSDPVLWLSTEEKLSDFVDAIKNMGYVALIGGRFIHITNGYDKGRALEWVMSAYRQCEPEATWCSYALGDSGNDLAMLECADQAIFVKSPVKGFPQTSRIRDVYYTEATGPSGWAEAINKLLIAKIKG